MNRRDLDVDRVELDVRRLPFPRAPRATAGRMTSSRYWTSNRRAARTTSNLASNSTGAPKRSSSDVDRVPLAPDQALARSRPTLKPPRRPPNGVRRWSAGG